jgi:hypothetical protein
MSDNNIVTPLDNNPATTPVPLPKGGVISAPNASIPVPETCPPPCICPPAQCYRWCIKRLDECLFQATNSDNSTTLMADSELSLSKLVQAASINYFTTTTPPCDCSQSNGCVNKTYAPFGCISREWVINVEYRPDCNQYFGSCNPVKKCY